jgi:hypothetical protein
VLAFNDVESADTRADVDADAIMVFVGDREAGVRHGLG